MRNRYRRAIEIDNDAILVALRQATDWIWEFQDNLKMNKMEMYDTPTEKARLDELLELIKKALEDRYVHLGVSSRPEFIRQHLYRDEED